MKRYYLSRRVGDGTDENPLRLKVMDYDAAVSNIFDQARNWGLAIVACADHTPIIADPDCIALPDLSLDAVWSTLSLAQRNFIKNKLTELGLDVTMKTSDPYRLLIRLLGRKFGAAFDENRFDVQEPN